MESLRANIVHVTYRNQDGTWSVAKMALNKEGKRSEVFTATGNIPYSETEETIQMYGEWIQDSKYGKQFKVENAHRVLPSTVSGLANYLASSEDIKGIGRAKANLLAERFGSGLLKILEENPSRLVECPGISITLANRIGESWKQDSAVRQISMFLAQHGISPRWAGRILKKWTATTAIDALTNNPYKLTQIDGIGFLTADSMAKALNKAGDSIERLEAACKHVLAASTMKGNTFLHEGELILAVVALTYPKTKSSSVLAKAEARAKIALDNVIEREELIIEEISDGISTLRLLYLPWLHSAEKQLAEDITELNSYAHKTPKGLDSAILEVQSKLHVPFSVEQIAAIRGAFSNHTLVITGGPGTGKTTCTRAICEIAASLQMECTLTAPTGRAAKRLSEVTGRDATTIHRLLKWRDDGPTHKRGVPINADILIVDESSMLDIELCGQLVQAVPNHCSIIFIGDADQLPAVGPGTVLRDIIQSKCVQTSTLETIFRQAESSLIIRNAHLIRKGEIPRFPETKGVKEDSYVMWIPHSTKKEEGKDDVEWVKSKLGRLAGVNIPEKFGTAEKPIDPIRDIQVLVPMKKHTIGAHELNRVLQQSLNPNGEQFLAGGKTFRHGDRVMQMRNNYEEGMDVYNGDIGFITTHNGEDKTIQVDFYGRRVDYPYSEVDDLSLAYAQTIHKAQGSEYPIVIVVMGYQHWPMLERNLLYTANTRARDLCVYVASKGAIEYAVKNNPVKSRNSYLSQRLKEMKDE